MPDDGERWGEVCRLLEGRPHWRVEASSTPGAPPRWCFAEGGEIELAVSTDDGICVYLMDTDREVRLGTVDELAAWLDANERAADHPAEMAEVVEELVHGEFVHWGTEPRGPGRG